MFMNFCKAWMGPDFALCFTTKLSHAVWNSALTKYQSTNGNWGSLNIDKLWPCIVRELWFVSELPVSFTVSEMVVFSISSEFISVALKLCWAMRQHGTFTGAVQLIFANHQYEYTKIIKKWNMLLFLVFFKTFFYFLL